VLSLIRYLLLLLPFSVSAATDDLLFGLGLRQGGGVAVSYTAFAVDFNGSADYARRSDTMTGLADGKVGTVSLWFRADGGDGTLMDFISVGTAGINRMIVQKTTGNAIRLQGVNASGTTILDATTATTFTAGAGWHHILAAWDMANSSNRAIYLDGSLDSTTWTTYTDDTIDYLGGSPRTTVGANNANTAALLWDGCISEFWFDDTYTDLSVQATREKFRSAAGKPVNLGSDGSVPTGTQPVYYFRTASPDWETNSGSAGNFTENGTLDACSTVP